MRVLFLSSENRRIYMIEKEKTTPTTETGETVLEKIRRHTPPKKNWNIVEMDHYKQIVGIPNKTERILFSLVDLIAETGLRGGDRLPSEKEMCELLGVGTRSLREALIGLRTLGLLESQQGTGWYVKEFKPTTSLKFLAPIIQNFSHADIKEIIATRLSNEPSIAAAAAKNISESGLEALQKALAVMKETTSDAEFRFNDRKFHDILAQECGNSIMEMISSMLTGLFYVGHLLPKAGDHLHVIHQHQAIYDAIQSRDPQKAEDAMRAHLLDAREFVNRLIREDRIEAQDKVFNFIRNFSMNVFPLNMSQQRYFEET